MFFIEARAALRQLLPAAKWGSGWKILAWRLRGLLAGWLVGWFSSSVVWGSGVVAPQSVLHKYKNIQFTSVPYTHTAYIATTQCCLSCPATGNSTNTLRGTWQGTGGGSGGHGEGVAKLYKHIYIFTSMFSYTCLPESGEKSFYLEKYTEFVKSKHLKNK